MGGQMLSSFELIDNIKLKDQIQVFFSIHFCSLSNDCKNLPDIATKYAFSIRPYEFDKGLETFTKQV